MAQRAGEDDPHDSSNSRFSISKFGVLCTALYFFVTVHASGDGPLRTDHHHKTRLARRLMKCTVQVCLSFSYLFMVAETVRCEQNHHPDTNGQVCLCLR